MSQTNDSPRSEEPGNGEEGRNYVVGYKKPPRETQFQKGQSGNPNGRPKGLHNFQTDLAAELNERVRITEGGEAKLLTKQQALIKRTMDKAFKGDMRAIEALVKWRGVYLEEDISEVEAAPLSKNDQAILARARATWAKGQHAQHEPGDDS